MIQHIYLMLTSDTISKMSKFTAVTLCYLFSSSFIAASGFDDRNNESYKKYFQQQEEIYRDLEALGIPGACPLNIDEALAGEILAMCPEEIKNTISGIEQSMFYASKKNIILHGMSGTGKSCLAQAIAIKTQTPCLFFNAGDISTEYMNSGVQNLIRIFQYARSLEKNLGKPCIVIFDELEALTKKHTSKNNPEHNILVSFWQMLDKFKNSKVVVIGTMNRTDDVPTQITRRTSMIEIPLPTPKHIEAILSYHLKEKQNKHNLIYSEWITAAYLARKTKGFSHSDLQTVVEDATWPVALAPILPGDRSNKIVPDDSFARAIKQVKKDLKRKSEREIGTWKHSLKTHVRDPRAITLALGVTGLYGLYRSVSNQDKGLTLQEEGLSNQRKSLDLQDQSISLQEASLSNQEKGLDLQDKAIKQSQSIADKQMSIKQILKQAIINSSVSGIFAWGFLKIGLT
jgi:hypothetical protein